VTSWLNNPEGGAHADAFPSDGSGLARYASIFNAAEINATFYRTPHASTLERWRDRVPEAFRFSVKVPKTITHEQRLVNSSLCSLRGITLTSWQPPGSLVAAAGLAFESGPVEAFLREAKEIAPSTIILEPRHPSWLSGEADALLASNGIARAGADPERALGALFVSGSPHISYRQLHGSPARVFLVLCRYLH
jgi:uncharacterized protein YecE (DUF72 family)